MRKLGAGHSITLRGRGCSGGLQVIVGKCVGRWVCERRLGSTGRRQSRGRNLRTGSPLSNQLTTANITDPSLNNIVSATLTIPAGWKLQGITMISPCTFSPGRYSAPTRPTA